LEVDAIARVEGFADTSDGDLHGWAWCPNDLERDPTLSIVSLDGKAAIKVVANNRADAIMLSKPLARPRGFRIPAAQLLQFDGLVHVRGPDGRNLTGSPLDPSAERRSAVIASDIIARLFPASADASRNH
jgi:hypothetical protein